MQRKQTSRELYKEQNIVLHKKNKLENIASSPIYEHYIAVRGQNTLTFILEIVDKETSDFCDAAYNSNRKKYITLQQFSD